MPSNIIEHLENFAGERYRSLIIHAVPDKSPALSVFSKKVCDRLNAKYVDLLDLFIQSQNLSEKIDVFSPEKLQELLVVLSNSCSIVFIDRADFLLDTWSKSDRQDFYRMINNQWDGYKESMKSILIFCLQTSQELESLVIKDSHDNTRIFRLSDFIDIN